MVNAGADVGGDDVDKAGKDRVKVCVLGAGSFGTAIANIIASNGHDATLWFRDVERADACRRDRENKTYLPGFKLSNALNISSSLEDTVENCEIVVIAVPSSSVREVAQSISSMISPGTIVVSTTKGIESPGFVLMSQILEQELPTARLGVLSGPNFAFEIIQNHYTGSVIASEDEQVRELVPKIFSSGTFRIYSNRDRYGVELGGALKNIYAIVTGLAKELGTGHNTMAMLLTRSLAEIGRFANEMGADAMTCLGLAGVGDLILTCTSDLSRNYRFGRAIGRGVPIDDALAEVGQVVEGVNTLKIVKEKADELGVYMPLASGLYAILFEKQEIASIIKGLMSGEITTDVEYQH